MAIKGTLESRIRYRIKLSRSPVFVRQNFADIGGYDQVGRILGKLVAKELLISLGYGVYTRTKKSQLNGKMIPELPLSDLAKEALRKLGVETAPATAEKRYRQGLSNQVPTGRVVGVKGRVARKLGYNGKSISFEHVT